MLKIKSKQLYCVKITIEKFILDMVLPNRCVRCQREGGIFCDRCKKYISIINPGYVMNDMYGFEKLLVAGLKEGWFERMVRDFKYKGRRDYGEFLAEKLGKVILSEVEKMKLSGEWGGMLREFCDEEMEVKKIVLVPLTTIRKHIRERGFDHTLRLCFELEKFLQKKLDDFGISVEYQNLLVRKNKTVQVGKERTERVKQAEKAYGICEGVKLDMNTLYILVDDVTTTGASLAAAKKILQANLVWAAVLMKER